MANGISVLMWVMCIICVFGAIGLIVYGCFVNLDYETKIGAYMENSRDCLTPECMLGQLGAARLAMVNAGLTDSDYGAYFFKKPDNSMVFQYQHLDSIIERAKDVAQWKESTYGPEAKGTETMKDVYNEKMDNLRLYIHGEGSRSDWIAQRAWYAKNHFILGAFGFIGFFLLAILSIVFGIIGAITWRHSFVIFAAG
jgi:hypothetical protein